MRLTFFGAARAVTGSCFLLEAAGKRILIECGLQQGKDVDDNSILPFEPSGIDCVIITHAHIDHSGRLPLLYKLGFRGNVYATGMTCKLMNIMLRDSGYIQESEAEWENRKGERAGKRTLEPLYTVADAEKVTELFFPCKYGEKITLFRSVDLRFADAGHILGAAIAELWVREKDIEKKIVFSGDLGNLGQPVIRGPQTVDRADYVVMESTYGDRNHNDSGEYVYELAEIIDTTMARGGNVIIPSFAVGRAQELLYHIREIKERGMVESKPDFPVFLDSPLAREATRIFSGDLTGYLDEKALEFVTNNVDMFSFNGLRICESTEESKALNEDKTPKVIISASGMCDAGRIRHHLKHNLWRKESTILFVGFQRQGSLGRMILDGAESVKLFGEEIAVKAEVKSLGGLSAHADRNGLISWINAFSPEPEHIFIVHGEAGVATAFAGALRDMGFMAHAPEYKEVYDLALDEVLVSGTPLVSGKKPVQGETPAYRRLVAAGEELIRVIAGNKGGTNKDLGKFADQIRALIKKWMR